MKVRVPFFLSRKVKIAGPDSVASARADLPPSLLKDYASMVEDFRRLVAEEEARLKQVLDEVDGQDTAELKASNKDLEVGTNKDLVVDTNKDSVVDTNKQTSEPIHFSFDAALDAVNRKRNRYANIMPWDHNRVHLSVSNGHSDYINASHISLLGLPYIATQAPLVSTIDHFWHMVWSNDASVIVMLTPLKEGKVVKSERYWPVDIKESLLVSQKGGFSAGLKVTLVSEEIHDDYEVRHLDLELRRVYKGSDLHKATKRVTHLLYKCWADFNRPPKGKSIEHFMDLVDEVRADSPLVLHCSAGCGRTGTYMMIDSLRHLAKSKDPKLASRRKQLATDADFVFALNLELRTQRCGAVQTKVQYVYIHEELRRLLS